MCSAGALYISRVVHSGYRQYLDVDRGKKTFNTCLSILRQCSIADGDLPGRFSRVIAQIWAIRQEGMVEENSEPPTLQVTSRMFYSIVHDALLLWRKKYSGNPANGAPPLPPPFIPTSPSTQPSPGTSATHSQHDKAIVPSVDQHPRAAESSPGPNPFIPDLPDVTSRGDITTVVGEDSNSLWDGGLFGFFGSDGPHSYVPLTNFNTPSAESSWV